MNILFGTVAALPCQLEKDVDWTPHRDTPSFHYQDASLGDHNLLMASWQKSSLQITLTQVVKIAEDQRQDLERSQLAPNRDVLQI